MATSRRSISISTRAHQATTLSKSQKAFNDLIERIRKQRDRLAAWEVATAQYQQKYAADLVPALSTLTDLQRELVRTLDRWSCEPQVNKTDLRLIDEMIVDLAGPMLMERDDPEQKAIFNSHSDTDFDQVEAVIDEEMKSMVEDVFGIEAGTLDEIMEAAEEEVLENARQREVEREAEREAEREKRAEARAHRKSPKQRALDAQREEDAQRVSQSIREVYRRLASALHPDRETDLDEKKRKTALMQRVNAAYASNNLLQLLELQLELEHSDQSALDNISEERLQHYNQILKQQLAELAVEIRRVETDFKARFDLPDSAAVSPKTIQRELASYLSAVHHEIDRYRFDLRACANFKGLKQFLARKRRDQKAADMRF